MQTPQEAFNAMKVEVLSKLDYPEDKIHSHFDYHLHNAMKHNSMRAMRVPIEMYNQFIKFDRPFKMPEMMVALELLYSSTPNEMEMTITEYRDMIQEVYIPMREVWCQIEDEVSKPLLAKIEAQIKVTQAVPQAKKLYNLGQA